MTIPSERSTTDQEERPILFSGAMVRAIPDGKKTQTRRVMKVQPPPFVQATPDSHSPRHPEPYIDAYCGEHKTPQNPRGMGREWCWWTRDDRPGMPFVKCPYGQPGDLLWVRESWAAWPTNGAGDHLRVKYAADGVERGVYLPGVEWSLPQSVRRGGNAPPMFMPRWASRITLELTDVRVQRVQDISEEDARAEGATQREAGWCMDWSRVGTLSRFATASVVKGRNFAPLSERDVALGSAKTAFGSLWNSLNDKRGYGWDVNVFVWALTFRRIDNAV